MSKLKDVRRPTLAVIEENSLPEHFDTVGPGTEINKKLLDENDNVCSHMNLLKEKTVKLNLSTRRPSYVTWRNECIEQSGRGIKAKLPNVRGDDSVNGNELTLDKRIDNIDCALVWIKQELQAMRTQDQDIARKLLSLRHEMNALKLQWSCDDHKEMLEEAQCDLEEMHELQDICDTPLDSIQPDPLKQIGVTKMNLNTRRFSIL